MKVTLERQFWHTKKTPGIPEKSCWCSPDEAHRQFGDEFRTLDDPARGLVELQGIRLDVPHIILYTCHTPVTNHQGFIVVKLIMAVSPEPI